ncbi:MAG: hypothetical protein OIN84_13640, partial [Candidatus Methanoperedens sp.]|nr:hypothetical protein [Candidatus Methanoperedens sp.]
MNYLFHINENDITQLKNYELRPLLNQLLITEAKHYGIPASSVEITIEDNIADGGVDARIEHSVDVVEQCRIPYGLSVWQYKAGEVAAAGIRQESQKPGIQNAIANNGT